MSAVAGAPIPDPQLSNPPLSHQADKANHDARKLLLELLPPDIPEGLRPIVCSMCTKQLLWQYFLTADAMKPGASKATFAATCIGCRQRRRASYAKKRSEGAATLTPARGRPSKRASVAPIAAQPTAASMSKASHQQTPTFRTQKPTSISTISSNIF